MTLVEKCLAHTKRHYPAGYGFALTYLSDDLNPAHLRDAAFKIVSDGFAAGGMRGRDDRQGGRGWGIRKDPDMAAFVSAYATAERAEDWLIEGAQFVLGWAIAGNPAARNAMKLCGHPGYR